MASQMDYFIYNYFSCQSLKEDIQSLKRDTQALKEDTKSPEKDTPTLKVTIL